MARNVGFEKQDLQSGTQNFKGVPAKVKVKVSVGIKPGDNGGHKPKDYMDFETT
jgi:hypothetical protein